MTKLSCAVIRDLLPTYVEGLASADTNALVEEHVAGCETCRSVLEAMRADMESPATPDADDQSEIDFLRRNRRRNGRIVLMSIVGALLAIALGLAVKAFVIGNETAAGNLAATVEVEESHLALNLVPIDSASGIAQVSFDEHDGIVDVSTRSVLASPLHPGSYQTTFAATAPIKQVNVNGRVVWADGSEISALASTIFETRHAYMGDVSANNRTLVSLGAPNYLGSVQHELQTEAEPFGWTIYLQEEVASARRDLVESDMRSFAYVLLGVIDNLGEVSFRYTVDGQEQTLTVTTEDASSFFGQDIKGCYTNVRLLNELLGQTGLTAMMGV